MDTTLLALAVALTTLPHTQEAHKRWSVGARAVVDDALVVDLALFREGIDPEDASVVYGLQQLHLNDDDQLVDQAGVGWERLTGGTVVDPDAHLQTTESTSCAELQGSDPIPGVRRLVPLLARPVDDSHRHEATGGPEVVLATRGSPLSGDLEELALVVVRPGESVQVTTAWNPRTGAREEHIELSRSTTQQTVSLHRDERQVSACFQGTPPADGDTHSTRRKWWHRRG